MPLDSIIQTTLSNSLSFSLWTPFPVCRQFYREAGEVLELMIYEQVMSIKINGNEIWHWGKNILQKAYLHNLPCYILIVGFLFQLHWMNYIRYPCF